MSLASQDFLQKLQAAQPGVPVLELGGEDRVLRAIGRDKVDLAEFEVTSIKAVEGTCPATPSK